MVDTMIAANQCRGFTILELLIALTISALTALFVAPQAQSMVNQSRMASQVNTINTLIRAARFNAIDQQSTTTLCPSHDTFTCDVHDWQLPLIVFVDSDADGDRSKDEQLLYASVLPDAIASIKGPKKRLRFYGSGAIASTATIRVCALRGGNTLHRALIVSLQGRVRLSQDYNGDEIHETRPGKIINC